MSAAAAAQVAVVQNVVELMSSIENMQSCNKIATAQLIRSCDNLSTEHEKQFNGLETIYATRLAVCELLDAKVAIPAGCKSFVPTDAMVQKVTLMGSIKNGLLNVATLFTYNDYDSETLKQMQLCNNALHETSNWISFSNNKQNADISKSAQALFDSKDALNQSMSIMVRETTSIAVNLAKQDKDLSSHFNHLDHLAKMLNDYVTAAGTAVHSLDPINDIANQLNLTLSNALAQAETSQLAGVVHQLTSDISLARGDLSEYQKEVRDYTDKVETELNKTHEALFVVREGLEDLPALIGGQIQKAILYLPRHMFLWARSSLVKIISFTHPTVPVLLAILVLILLARLIRHNISTTKRIFAIQTTTVASSAENDGPTMFTSTQTTERVHHEVQAITGAQILSTPAHQITPDLGYESDFSDVEGDDDNELPPLYPQVTSGKFGIQEIE
ncbi:Hypothetical protein D9617_19g103680 [Elsinoe fawcettii]|nr:Hypothetical protein D9617_19g103680 [Elsinoe fawcettii]